MLTVLKRLAHRRAVCWLHRGKDASIGWERLWRRPTLRERDRARIRRTLMACSIECATSKMKRDHRGGYY